MNNLPDDFYKISANYYTITFKDNSIADIAATNIIEAITNIRTLGYNKVIIRVEEID